MKQVTEVKDISDIMLDNLAKLLFAIFCKDYDKNFEKLLLSGGGGNSMFVNVWTKPSRYFAKIRISSQSIKTLKEHNYNKEDLKDRVPKEFIKNNAKTIQKRKSHGKFLHIDHNPSNVKVLELISNKIKNLNKGSYTKKEKIEKLKKSLKNIQSIDIITVEQDHKRTNSDLTYSKKEKDKMTKKQRDFLLKDKFIVLDETLAKQIIKRFL